MVKRFDQRQPTELCVITAELVSIHSLPPFSPSPLSPACLPSCFSSHLLLLLLFLLPLPAPPLHNEPARVGGITLQPLY